MPHDETFLILGGGGLVGLQIARRIASDLTPKKIVIVSLYRHEVDEALDELQHLFGSSNIEFVGYAGDVFTREEFSDQQSKVLESYNNRDKLYEDLFGRFDAAYAQSRLVMLIQEHRPDVIIDGINTATAISYQDVFTATITTKRKIDELFEKVAVREVEEARGMWKAAEAEFENLILFQSIPQLIRKLFIVQAMREVGTRLYLKIGTTGTGGMGLNIPYTHGEDKPSPVLMTKTAVAFAHTGLLFLMARTPGGPIVKELKPGAMIGYADITCRTVHTRQGKPFVLFATSQEPLSGSLKLKQDPSQYERLGLLGPPCYRHRRERPVHQGRVRGHHRPAPDGVHHPGRSPGRRAGDRAATPAASVIRHRRLGDEPDLPGVTRQQALDELNAWSSRPAPIAWRWASWVHRAVQAAVEAELPRIQYGTLAKSSNRIQAISLPTCRHLRENGRI
jgi:hypothetical protein